MLTQIAHYCYHFVKKILIEKMYEFFIKGIDNELHNDIMVTNVNSR